MKKLLFICLSLLWLSCNNSTKIEEHLPTKTEDQQVTTYYLIRHAEKDRTDLTNKNPNLKEIGKQRAENWSKVFQHVAFDNIYTTHYNRTIQTAQPTADAKNINLQFYNPSQLYDDAFIKDTKGKTVLVVGHSNTTPSFVNAILGEEKYQNINDTINGNLYIVTVYKHTKTHQLLSIN